MHKSNSIEPWVPVDPHEGTVHEGSDLVSELKHVERCHLRFQKAECEGVIAAFDAGAVLLTAKERTTYGEWERELRAAIKASRVVVDLRTCQRYMKVARLLLLNPASPAVDYLEAPSKTTRTSFLNFLREHGLKSINKVLALEPPEPRADSPSPPDEDDAAGECDERESCSSPDNDATFLTPDEILKHVIEFLGGIDLDPCASIDSSLHLPAGRSIALPEDSLSPGAEWSGSLYVHPPANNVLPFAIRTVAAIEDRESEVAIVLIPAVTDSDYMATLQPYAKGFLHRRPTFATPSGDLVRPATPYVLVLVTKDDSHFQRFADVVGPIADIYYPHRFV